MVLIGEVRRNTYVDSVVLMQVTEQVRAFPGVVAAALVMATDLNRELLAHVGLLVSEVAEAGSNDLVLAVRAESSEAARAALTRAEQLLAGRSSGENTFQAVLPRTILSAARGIPGANLAVISVPGKYAVAEAHQAFSAGLHVFLFSDHVPLADEVALKRRARGRGLLLMGPECGTSIINGVGLGFANRVRRGAIGLVGASGTGLQEVTSLVHNFGAGVSQVIGTGGRDLHEAVGGLTTLQTLEFLAQDSDTRAIVLISKPPSQAAAERILCAAAETHKAVVTCLLGSQGPTPPGVRAVATLEEAARAAVEAIGERPPRPTPPDRPRTRREAPGRVLGLFTGGTLCEEAQAIVGTDGHRFLDFGASEYTRGRPHPIIDPSLRNAAVAAAGDDPSVVVLLLDVILGYCAHPNPAGALAGALREARTRAERAGRMLDIVAHVVGTDEDPQRLRDQEAALHDLGVLLRPSNRLAAELARELAAGHHGG